ncbi:Ribosomal protein L11 methyltransferase [Fulvivirga imtechensis AK7]|uniref:Ribosomal protein L11 methyltransferase n=1 Tax=Fulvivirga imtechensis AK7 TaxID=1237149 RepID=L8JQS8_9BACT|nr:50S ribosomal protein L11 methyltransferase [Fulvivirga imtechensis]ELR69834.1 Ribosomal protein L11 methyltransferase [Fulvivirga imtechensis AK7]
MGTVDFISVRFACSESFKEIIIAELDALGYNSMMETDEGVEGYIEKEKFAEQEVEDLVDRYKDATTISYELEEVITRNWNEEWEKNYDPIIVDDQCLVRATFHPSDQSYPYEIIINPKMSFGTGHHATTYLMLKTQMDLDHRGRRVLDAGCGTAILAIMASKLGAREVIAYDIDSWSIENAPENVVLNGCENIAVLEGTIGTLGLQGQFDIILANINKNVLLAELGAYVSYLSPGGTLVLSGFYESDEADLIKKAEENHLQFLNKNSRNYWSVLIFEKK